MPPRVRTLLFGVAVRDHCARQRCCVACVGYQVEEEAKNVQLEKLAVEEENRQLRETNFELQSKTQADANTIKALQTKMADKDKQLKIMTDQNTELLRLLETEEAQTSKLNAENRSLREEVDAIRTKYSSLLASAKQHEELAAVAAREGQLRADELRLLRAEVRALPPAARRGVLPPLGA